MAAVAEILSGAWAGACVSVLILWPESLVDFWRDVKALVLWRR